MMSRWGAQLESLKQALLAAGFIVVLAFAGPRRMPAEPVTAA
jgi:hypothetical protein